MSDEETPAASGPVAPPPLPEAQEADADAADPLRRRSLRLLLAAGLIPLLALLDLLLLRRAVDRMHERAFGNMPLLTKWAMQAYPGGYIFPAGLALLLILWLCRPGAGARSLRAARFVLIGTLSCLLILLLAAVLPLLRG